MAATASVNPGLAAEELTRVYHSADVERAAVGGQVSALLEERHTQTAQYEAIGGSGTAGAGADDDRIVFISIHVERLRDGPAAASSEAPRPGS